MASRIKEVRFWPNSVYLGVAASRPLSEAHRLWRSRKQLVPSRPREFHPEPLTDPYVNLSIHTARVVARRLPPSAERSGSSRFDPVGPSSTAMTHPLCSTGITPLRRYYGAVRPSPAHRYFRPRGWRRLCLFPWHRRLGCRVDEDVTPLVPHRSGRADFQHPVPHGRASFQVA